MDEGIRHDLWRHFLFRCALLACGLTATLAAICVALLLFAWGSNQGFTPDYVEQRIEKGMDVSEAHKALGLPPPSQDQVLSVADGNEYWLITQSGCVGRWFVPQHDIVLIFDRHGRLVDGYAKITWRLDEVVRELDF